MRKPGQLVTGLCAWRGRQPAGLVPLVQGLPQPPIATMRIWGRRVLHVGSGHHVKVRSGQRPSAKAA